MPKKWPSRQLGICRSFSLPLIWKCFLLICLPLWTLPTFLQIKNVWKIKKVKNVTKIKKRKKFFFLHLCYALRCGITAIYSQTCHHGRAIATVHPTNANSAVFCERKSHNCKCQDLIVILTVTANYNLLQQWFYEVQSNLPQWIPLKWLP